MSFEGEGSLGTEPPACLRWGDFHFRALLRACPCGQETVTHQISKRDDFVKEFSHGRVSELGYYKHGSSCHGLEAALVRMFTHWGDSFILFIIFKILCLKGKKNHSFERGLPPSLKEATGTQRGDLDGTPEQGFSALGVWRHHPGTEVGWCGRPGGGAAAGPGPHQGDG